LYCIIAVENATYKQIMRVNADLIAGYYNFAVFANVANMTSEVICRILV